MNYIAHLTGFFHRVSRDYRLNPTHVSLYMALFLQWNLGRFRNPVSIARPEVMAFSRINAWGYLHYAPSNNHFRGSLVYMLDFGGEQDRDYTPNPAILCAGVAQEVKQGCAGSGEEVGPSINSINNTNFKNSLNGRGRAHGEGSENEQEGVRQERRKEKGFAEKEKNTAGEPPGLEVVRNFFLERGYLELEAFRFFHHYSANGWMLGRNPMQDWQAGARKWMLNGLSQKGEGDEKSQGNREAGLAGERDYSEPL